MDRLSKVLKTAWRRTVIWVHPSCGDDTAEAVDRPLVTILEGAYGYQQLLTYNIGLSPDGCLLSNCRQPSNGNASRRN